MSQILSWFFERTAVATTITTTMRNVFGELDLTNCICNKSSVLVEVNFGDFCKLLHYRGEGHQDDGEKCRRNSIVIFESFVEVLAVHIVDDGEYDLRLKRLDFRKIEILLIGLVFQLVVVWGGYCIECVSYSFFHVSCVKMQPKRRSLSVMF